MIAISCMSIRLGDLDFTTSRDEKPILAADGAVLSLHSMRGWEDSPEESSTVYAHPSGDGQSVGIRRYAPRQIVLQGLVKAKNGFGAGSPSQVATLMTRLGRTTLYIAEVGGFAREADVRVGWQMTRVPGAPHLAHFTASLIADDPLRYSSGTLLLPEGSTAIPNGGDRPAYPLIDVTGPVTIAHPAGTFTLTGTGERTIDCRNGEIWGRPTWNRPTPFRVTDQHTGAWPVVLPGGSQWWLTTAAPITVRRWEAWS